MAWPNPTPLHHIYYSPQRVKLAEKLLSLVSDTPMASNQLANLSPDALLKHHRIIEQTLRELRQHGHITGSAGGKFQKGRDPHVDSRLQIASAHPDHVEAFIRMMGSKDHTVRSAIAPDFVVDHLLPESKMSWDIHHLIRDLDDRTPSVHVRPIDPNESVKVRGNFGYEPTWLYGNPPMLHSLVLPHPDGTSTYRTLWPARKSEMHVHEPFAKYEDVPVQYHPERGSS